MLCGFVGACFVGAVAHAATDATVAEIVTAATASNDPANWPLPLFSSWESGGAAASGKVSGGQFSPERQVKLIKEGHHILPVFNLWRGAVEEYHKTYYKPLETLSAWHIPITIAALQWEAVLTNEEPFASLPADQNPNVVTTDGSIARKVSPFGPVAPWRQAGRTWTNHAVMQYIQKLYPSPQRVILLSNNEHAKLRWTDAASSRRFHALYPNGLSEEKTREAFAKGWRERYSALFDGMRDELVAPWEKAALFVGYDAADVRIYARWNEWQKYALTYPGHLTGEHLFWDGGSPSYYLNPWQAIADFTVFSPQVELMNEVMVLREIYRERPQFWYEMSIWDGYDWTSSDPEKNKVSWYQSQGQAFTPARYKAWTRFGMWLIRPRVVREFRAWTETWDRTGPYTMAAIEAVDEVYALPLLRTFWQRGTLVPNTAQKHPYQANTISAYDAQQRWYLLTADANPPQPWSLSTKLPVFALARVVGESPHREWLLYAYAPLGDRNGVNITVPGYGTVGVDVPTNGAFYHLVEGEDTPHPVTAESVSRWQPASAAAAATQTTTATAATAASTATATKTAATTVSHTTAQGVAATPSQARACAVAVPLHVRNKKEAFVAPARDWRTSNALITPFCTDDALAVRIGEDSSDVYIWHTAYVAYKDEKLQKQYPVELTGTTVGSGAAQWIRGSATARIPDITQHKEGVIAAYMCYRRTDRSWACGCHSATDCAAPSQGDFRWFVEGFSLAP